jgi:hypothetical protein
VAVSIIRADETWHDRSTPGAAEVPILVSSPVTRVETKKAAPTVFGNQDAIAQRSSPELVSNHANVKTLEPLHDTCIRCKPAHPSPSARPFRLLLNDLATSALSAAAYLLAPSSCARIDKATSSTR